MKIQVLERAEKMWRGKSLAAMLQQWDESESKLRQERLIAEKVGCVGTVADLGCGNGRLSRLLNVLEGYWGYDTSPDMLVYALGPKGSHPCVHYEQRDVFSSAPDREFDIVVLYDVAMHQSEPVAAVRRMLELWRGEYYIFSLLVGDERENLLASTVVAFSELLDLLDDLNVTSLHIERLGSERFGWVLVEAEKKDEIASEPDNASQQDEE